MTMKGTVENIYANNTAYNNKIDLRMKIFLALQDKKFSLSEWFDGCD